MLDFWNLTFSSPNFCMLAIVPPQFKFRLNLTIWSRVIAKKRFSIWRPSASWIWKFLKFSHVCVAWVKICVCVPNFVIFGLFAAEIWRYNEFSKNGGRPPCWIYCDVINVYRKTEFNALDIVLNFDIHRFHTFWYTSTIMFHHFSLKLPIFAVIFTYFWKIWENIKFKYCNPQKAHLCVRPRVLNSRCLTYFYICDLYIRRKKLFDCVLVRKNWNFPYLPSQNGLTDFCQILHENSTPQRNDIYTRRLLNIFSRFLFTEGSNLPYSIARMASNTA